MKEIIRPVVEKQDEEVVGNTKDINNLVNKVQADISVEMTDRDNMGGIKGYKAVRIQHGHTVVCKSLPFDYPLNFNEVSEKHVKTYLHRAFKPHKNLFVKVDDLTYRLKENQEVYKYRKADIVEVTRRSHPNVQRIRVMMKNVKNPSDFFYAYLTLDCFMDYNDIEKVIYKLPVDARRYKEKRLWTTRTLQKEQNREKYDQHIYAIQQAQKNEPIGI